MVRLANTFLAGLALILPALGAPILPRNKVDKINHALDAANPILSTVTNMIPPSSLVESMSDDYLMTGEFRRNEPTSEFVPAPLAHILSRDKKKKLTDKEKWDLALAAIDCMIKMVPPPTVVQWVNDQFGSPLPPPMIERPYVDPEMTVSEVEPELLPEIPQIMEDEWIVFPRELTSELVSASQSDDTAKIAEQNSKSGLFREAADLLAKYKYQYLTSPQALVPYYHA